MCRHLGYLGPSAAVGEILTRGTHSLRAQAWEPRDMRGGGTINADGFGVAWWTPDGASRYRNPAAIWTDPAVEEVLPQLRSTAVLAAVRSATVGTTIERNANAPFTHGRWAFSHNGRIPDWQRVLAEIAAEFGSPSLLEAEAHTDTAALWVIVRGLLDAAGASADAGGVARASEHSGALHTANGTAAGPAGSAGGDGIAVESASEPAGFARGDGVAVRPASEPAGSARGDDVAGWPAAVPAGSGVVAEPISAADPAAVLPRVIRAVLARSPLSRLNLLLSDGETLWATTVHHALSVLVTDDFAVVSSEPYDDDPRWQHIPDRRLVTLRPGLLTLDELDTLDIDVSERAPL